MRANKVWYGYFERYLMPNVFLRKMSGGTI